MNNFRKLANNEGYLIDLQGIKIYFPQESIDHIEKSGHMNPKDASGSVFKKGINIETIFQEMIDNSSRKELKGNMIQFETNSHIGYDAYIDNMVEPDGFIIKTDRDKKVLALAQKNDRFAVEGSFHSNATNFISGIIIDSSSVKLEKNNIPSDFEAREIYDKGMLNYGISLFPGKAFKINGEAIPRTTQMNTEGFLTQNNINYIPAKLDNLEDYKKVRDIVNSQSLTSNYTAEDIQKSVNNEVKNIKKDLEVNELRNKNSTFNPAIHVKKKNQDGEQVIGFKVIPFEFSNKLEKAIEESNERKLRKEKDLKIKSPNIPNKL